MIFLFVLSVISKLWVLLLPLLSTHQMNYYMIKLKIDRRVLSLTFFVNILHCRYTNESNTFH